MRGLSKRFGAEWALRDAAFEIRPGEVLGLIGPNGSGKTTLFECLAGLLDADAGRVEKDGPEAQVIHLRARDNTSFQSP